MTEKPCYNPDIHHRRSIRLKGYDYSQSGAYFITICTDQKECRFGDVIDGEMVLNDLGKIAHEQWGLLGVRLQNISIDEFVIMPNHMHGIIIINKPGYLNPRVGAGFTPARSDGCELQSGQPQHYTSLSARGLRPTDNDDGDFQSGQPQGLPLLGNIIGAYKSLAFKECLAFYKSQDKYLGKFWQRNYYEYIIRNEASYQKIVEYIQNNPAHWELDKYFAKRK